jgi:hypothetical protein
MLLTQSDHLDSWPLRSGLHSIRGVCDSIDADPSEIIWESYKEKAGNQRFFSSWSWWLVPTIIRRRRKFSMQLLDLQSSRNI